MNLPDWLVHACTVIAKGVAHDIPSHVWSQDDLEQEALAYCYQRTDWHDQWETINQGYVHQRLRQELRNIVLRDHEFGVGSTDAIEAGTETDMLVKGGGHVPKHHDNIGKHTSKYDRAELEQLLPGIWNEEVALFGINRETRPDMDMPKGKGSNPAHSFTSVAKVADVQRAWKLANLTDRQRRVILLRYGAGWTRNSTATTIGASTGTVSGDESAAIDLLLEFLNGGE